MLPTLFEIPGIGLKIPGYGLMMMLGFLTAILWASRRALRSGGNDDIVMNCGFIALIGGIVGARAMYVLAHPSEFIERGVLSIFNVMQGGLEFYGGFIAATIGVVGYLTLWKHSLRWYLDIIAPSAMLGLAFGRIGCYLNGCCWGGVCALPWAVTFPHGSPVHLSHWAATDPAAAAPAELLFSLPDGRTIPISRDSLWAGAEKVAAAQQEVDALEEQVATWTASGQTGAELEAAQRRLERANYMYRDVRTVMREFDLTFDQVAALAAQQHSAPVHPAQLYAAIAALILAVMLDRLYRVRKRDGIVICTLLTVQPAARFLLEIIRTDVAPNAWLLTRSQVIALVLVAIGVIGLLAIHRLPPRSPRAKRWAPPAPTARPANA